MKTIKFIFVFVVTAMIGTAVQAQIQPVNEEGIAIGGYDVVSYFSGEAKRGFKDFSAEHKGVTYHFSTKENKAAFQEAPDNYLPQFDGFCAWGVGAKSAKFPIDPESFDIVDGKLYLFFNAPFNGEQFNTLLDWNRRTTELMEAAHEQWSEVKKK